MARNESEAIRGIGLPVCISEIWNIACDRASPYRRCMRMDGRPHACMYCMHVQNTRRGIVRAGVSTPRHGGAAAGEQRASEDMRTARQAAAGSACMQMDTIRQCGAVQHGPAARSRRERPAGRRLAGVLLRSERQESGPMDARGDIYAMHSGSQRLDACAWQRR